MLKKSESVPFWKQRSLSELSEEEWESLCDGCGKCCLIKLQDEETEKLYHTKLTCHLLEIGQCKCSNYEKRFDIVHDCIDLTPENVATIPWLPNTCAYRLVHEGKDLHWWHPLISGDKNTVHEAGVSVRDWARSEAKVEEPMYYKYIIHDQLHTEDVD